MLTGLPDFASHCILQLLFLRDFEEVEFSSNQVAHAVIVERSCHTSKSEDEEGNKPSNYSKSLVELISYDCVMLHEEGVIESEVIVKALSDGPVVSSFHLVEGIDVVGNIGEGRSIEADFIIVGDGHLGKSDILLDRLSDVVGVKNDRCDFVGEGALQIIPIGHCEVEFRVVALKEILKSQLTGSSVCLVVDGEGETFT